MNSKQKSIILLIASAVIVLVILGGAIFSMMSKKDIMDKFNKYYNSDKKTVIYYVRTGCGYCSMQTPTLEALDEEYGIDYLKIDAAELTASQKKEILEKLDIEDATPTTVVVQNGKVISTAIGFKSGNQYVEFFKEAGILDSTATYNSKAAYEDAPNLTIINFDDYKDLIDSGELFVVTVGQTGCSHCNAIRPALDRVVTKNGLKIYYLNLTDLVGSERSGFYQTLNDMEYSDPSYLEDGSFGTPTTFTIENGKIKYYISGERTYSKLVTEFTKQGLITE